MIEMDAINRRPYSLRVCESFSYESSSYESFSYEFESLSFIGLIPGQISEETDSVIPVDDVIENDEYH
jgi:hypothetical protein